MSNPPNYCTPIVTVIFDQSGGYIYSMSPRHTRPLGTYYGRLGMLRSSPILWNVRFPYCEPITRTDSPFIAFTRKTAIDSNANACFS